MTRATLLLRCAGPMQSWGTRSRFTERDTEAEPTKSGVVGLVAAALGRGRDEPLDDLAALRMAVRIDRPGRVEVDYQTAGAPLRVILPRSAGATGPRGTGRRGTGGVARADGTPGETLPSRRWYLADADFLVGLEGDRGILQSIEAALRAPRWPLYLGRKGYVPGVPLSVPGGLRDEPLVEALQSWPLPEPVARTGAGMGLVSGSRTEASSLELVVECAPGEPGDPRTDVPLSFTEGDRRYSRRLVRRIRIPCPE